MGIYALEKLDKSADIDVLGLNCSLGPHAMLSAVEKVINKITKPLVVQPNAGHPQKLDGRMIYLSSFVKNNGLLNCLVKKY